MNEREEVNENKMKNKENREVLEYGKVCWGKTTVTEAKEWGGGEK